MLHVLQYVPRCLFILVIEQFTSLSSSLVRADTDSNLRRLCLCSAMTARKCDVDCRSMWTTIPSEGVCELISSMVEVSRGQVAGHLYLDLSQTHMDSHLAVGSVRQPYWVRLVLCTSLLWYAVDRGTKNCN